MIAPYRYTTKRVNVPWMRTLRDWWQGNGWSRTRVAFSDPIKPGEPGYDEAEYEEHLICHTWFPPLVKSPEFKDGVIHDKPI
jgi:hypothetical protein